MARRERNIIDLPSQRRRRAPVPVPKAPRRPFWSGRRRPWRKVMVIALLAALVLFGYGGMGILRTANSGSSACTIVTVVDGDTVRAFCPGRGFLKVRLTGFDTPEVYSPRCFSEWWAGTKASWALNWHLWFADETSLVITGKDRYGRALAALFVDGRNIASTMIGEGHARPYAGGKRTGWCW